MERLQKIVTKGVKKEMNYTHHNVRPNGKQKWIGEIHILTPVSYTHLDVYKRQPHSPLMINCYVNGFLYGTFCDVTPYSRIVSTFLYHLNTGLHWHHNNDNTTYRLYWRRSAAVYDAESTWIKHIHERDNLIEVYTQSYRSKNRLLDQSDEKVNFSTEATITDLHQIHQWEKVKEYYAGLTQR